MSQAKMVAMAGAATFILSMVGAVSSSTAAKMTWFVNGTELKTGETATTANTERIDSQAFLGAPGLSLRITCSGGSGSKGELQGESAMAQAEAVTLEGCSEISPATCKLASSDIVSESILAFVSSVPARPLPAVSIVLQPKKGNTFATLRFEDNDHPCSIEGEQAVDGKLVAVAPTGASEETLQAVEAIGSVENNSLLIDGDRAYVEDGKALVKLVGSQRWSFRE